MGLIKLMDIVSIVLLFIKLIDTDYTDFFF
jgi:hypothetical protein